MEVVCTSYYSNASKSYPAPQSPNVHYFFNLTHQPLHHMSRSIPPLNRPHCLPKTRKTKARINVTWMTSAVMKTFLYPRQRKYPPERRRKGLLPWQRTRITWMRMSKWPINKSHLCFTSLVLIYTSYFTYPCSIHAAMLAISSFRSPLSLLITKDPKKFFLPYATPTSIYFPCTCTKIYWSIAILLVFVNERESGFWLCRYHLHNKERDSVTDYPERWCLQSILS